MPVKPINKASPHQTVLHQYEAEVAPGLESVTSQEIQTTQRRVSDLEITNGAVRFRHPADFQPLSSLRTVNALYRVLTFDVPRPKALLGHQHFQRMVQTATEILQTYPKGTFQTLSIDAAGSDSSVMQRVRNELADAVSLTPSADRGDLVIRIRPTADRTGWEALLRLSPRPLATRDWRVANFEGALNAAVAHAMIRLTNPSDSDGFLNLCAGSGTLLIERAAAGPATLIAGCDIAAPPLELARLNIDAAQAVSRISLFQADAGQLPLDSSSIDTIAVDLPFGQLVGSHQQNRQLYPAVLREIRRVLRPDSTATIITHEIRLFESLLNSEGRQSPHSLSLQKVYKITLNGLHPRIYILRKTVAH